MGEWYPGRRRWPGALLVAGSLAFAGAVVTKDYLWTVQTDCDGGRHFVDLRSDTPATTVQPGVEQANCRPASDFEDTADAASPSNTLVLPENEVRAGSTPTASQQAVKDALSSIGENKPWCGPNGITYKNGGTDADPVISTAKVCLEELELNVLSSRIVAHMRTDPRIDQSEGNTSLYLTYEKTPSDLELCQQNKEAMREGLHDSLVQVVGDPRANEVDIEIHVDPRAQAKCDDPGP